MKTVIQKCKVILAICMTIIFSNLTAPVSQAFAQSVLFDFDNAPLYTSLPISQTVGGITAHLSATGQGYSIQDANVLGFTPSGFAGRILYPNSVYLADLIIGFDQTLTGFSIMYSCQELGCDDAATMRVTAYLNGSYIGTDTRVAGFPGTWPVDILTCNFPQGFDSVVIHYDSPPPTCQDYGVIYMADNMVVTALNTGSIFPQTIWMEAIRIPNPVVQSATLSFSLLISENMHVVVYDITGRIIARLFDGVLNPGKQQIKCDLYAKSVQEGIYFVNLSSDHFSQSYKLVVLK